MNWKPMPTRHCTAEELQIGQFPYVTLAEDTHFGKWQRERGFIDEPLMRCILPHIPPGCVAIDGGAFNGEHAIAYSRIARLVCAFEPQLPAFLCLCTNVFLGHHFNVKPFQIALSDRLDEFYRFPDWTGEPDNYGARWGQGLGQRGQHGRIEPQVHIDVPGLALDDFLFGMPGRVGFIKLDLEGCELRALRGARHVIEQHRPTMWIEMNAGTLGHFGYTPDDVLALLEGLRYDVKAGTGHKGGEQWDALCLPR